MNGHVHSTDIDDRLGRSWWGGGLVDLNLDDTEGRTDSQCSIENVDSEDDRVSTGKCLKDLESTRPVGSSGSLGFSLFDNLLVVSGELIEEVVNDIGCRGVNEE